MFAPDEHKSQRTPCYFNSGCALYNDGITNLEIAENKICLVKWHRKIDAKEPREIYGELEVTPELLGRKN